MISAYTQPNNRKNSYAANIHSDSDKHMYYQSTTIIVQWSSISTCSAVLCSLASAEAPRELKPTLQPIKPSGTPENKEKQNGRIDHHQSDHYSTG